MAPATARSLLVPSMLLAWLLGGAACTVEPHAAEPAKAGAPGDRRDGAVEPAAAEPGAPRPDFVAAGEGDADAVVRDALRRAEHDGRRLVVYVGATWCEPCQAFHQAVERGELDEPLAGVRFLEFDSDHDGARLQATGYGGRYIPRFVLPGPDGRGTEQRMEGGIKGEGAVANLMERLQPLLASATP